MTTTVRSIVLAVVAILILATVQPVLAQEQEMTKDQWQSEMSTLTARRNQLQSQLQTLNKDITDLQARATTLDGDLRSCEDALYAMIGVTRADVEAFDRELTGMENRVNELQRMSDAQLMGYRDEIEKMDARLKEMAKSRITMIPRYHDRVTALQDRVAALMKMVSREKTYTVGTWSRDRDCLWNIAKKRDIYDNAWLWPKIWQSNRDKIRDPDVIKPKWVLKIPEKADLTREERNAANQYYRRKASAPSAE
jgi:DNA repair exonuclease SbcCD ATPase subunit